MDSTPNPLIQFKASPIHGLGAFARVPIHPGTRIIEYIGEKITTAESLRRCQQGNHFIFALSPDTHIDGNVDWNPARWINHSCAPNSEAQLADNKIWLVAIRPIHPNEEITFNYGYDLEDYREYTCNCGAPNCIGYIVDQQFFDHIRAARR